MAYQNMKIYSCKLKYKERGRWVYALLIFMCATKIPIFSSHVIPWPIIVVILTNVVVNLTIPHIHRSFLDRCAALLENMNYMWSNNHNHKPHCFPLAFTSPFMSLLRPLPCDYTILAMCRPRMLQPWSPTFWNGGVVALISMRILRYIPIRPSFAPFIPTYFISWNLPCPHMHCVQVRYGELRDYDYAIQGGNKTCSNNQ